MKVIIAGGRDFEDYGKLCYSCNMVLFHQEDVEVVSGGAHGADKLGERYAKEHGYPVKQFPANWNKYGKSAGFRRNAEMAKYADALFAFWDGESKGTEHMIKLAKRYDLKVRVFYYGKAYQGTKT